MTYAISIHAPREGGDDSVSAVSNIMQISIHAPREGGDVDDCIDEIVRLRFQSTPPARGATEALASVD